MLVLGIETSCDETGVGIVRGHTLLADAVASSVDEHARFGGVVPEVASRAHLEAMVPTIERACETAGVRLVDIDAVAVTSGPGLAGALLVGLYFAYWHDGFYLGPRFLFPLLPLLALWTARLPAVLRDWADPGRSAPAPAGYAAPPAAWRGFVYRGTIAALVAAAVLGLLTTLPLRVSQYRSGLVSLRWDADRAAARAGVQNALVLVRESWGAELVARLWALGIPRPDAERLYRTIDACRLETALSALEATSTGGTAAGQALEPLTRDSSRLAGSEATTGDPSLRLRPGERYPAYCLEKIRQNQAGFTVYAPLLLGRAGGNVYARDLGPRDSLLVDALPDRTVYLLRPASGAVGAPPVFRVLDRDSLRVAWRGR